MSPPPALAENLSTPILAALPPGAGVAVVRLRSLGDTLLATPALAALKRWRPDLRIAMLVEPRFTAVLNANPDVDEVIEVASGVAGRLAALRRLRRFRPALAVSLHGSVTAAWLNRASGARHRATFAALRHAWAYNFRAPTQPRQSPSASRRLHTVEHVASLFEALGLPPSPLGPTRLFPRESSRAAMRRRLGERGLQGPYAFLNTEAREPGMRWPLENFAALAAWLRAERGCASVMASAGAGTPIPGAVLVAPTSVDQLIALEADADLIVGNDGGPIHIAAALGKPTVALYSSTDIPVWVPWQTRSRALQADDLAALSVTQVEASILDLLPNRG